jgi:hypothetical protein
VIGVIGVPEAVLVASEAPNDSESCSPPFVNVRKLSPKVLVIAAVYGALFIVQPLPDETSVVSMS